ncbi:ATP-binding protein [Kitasatospora sp. NPDC094015]|uniref:ATP-binding protein n=1 Tax=Kitasatospora sp. NPDC094015 TaxID=3155205 RepID=UPI00332D95F8
MNPTTAIPAGRLGPVEKGDLIVLVGASGSGKSTLLADVPAYQVVSLDRLRAVVSAPGDQTATADAVLLQHQILLARLRRGVTTYVDNTSLSTHHRAQLVELAHQHGRRVIAAHFDAPLPLCIERNRARPAEQRVPEDVLRRQHRMSRSARELLATEGFDEIRQHRTWH